MYSKEKKKYIDLKPIFQVDRNNNIYESVSIVILMYCEHTNSMYCPTLICNDDLMLN